MNKKNLSLCLIFLLLITKFSSAHAMQNWSSFCAVLKADSISVQPNLIKSRDYKLQVPASPAISMDIGTLTAKAQNLDVSADQFQKMTDLTSIALLSAILNNPVQKCEKQVYIDTFAPIIKNLEQKGAYQLLWNDIVIRNSDTTIKADTVRAKIEAEQGRVHVVFSFSGLVDPRPKLPKAFIPKNGSVDFYTPASSFPLLLAGGSGYNQKNSIPVTLQTMTASNSQASITLSGNASLNNKLQISNAKGNLAVTHLPTLIQAGQEAQLRKVSTALILAKFAGYSVGNDTLKWSIDWKNRLLKVNNIPIPIW